MNATTGNPDKVPFFDFTPSKGVIRIGRTHAFVAVFSTTCKTLKILPSYLMLGIGGIGHINLSHTTGTNVTIRIPGGTDKVSKWLKIGTNGKTRKIGTTILNLNRWENSSR